MLRSLGRPACSASGNAQALEARPEGLGVSPTGSGRGDVLGLRAFLAPVIAGPLAITAGVAGIHYAHHGTGRLWTAITGTILGAAAFGSSITVVSMFSI
ncbi:hypothetical protein [Streptomyces chryseus]|uniref:hypothetical protein n=1 Tax=Streptomyces chryseus TaxID=68186 RepID=UPI00110FBF10|nr:hypothetical protein [Streptomyces chryseus]